MKYQTVTKRIGEWLGPIDWDYDFRKYDWGPNRGGSNPEHTERCIKRLKKIASAPDEYEATTDSGQPKYGWGRVLKIGMYDGWPYWEPTPSVLIDGHMGASAASFLSITAIRKARQP